MSKRDTRPKTKRVDWACPTSTTAKRLGFYETGCWTVDLQPADKDKPALAIAGFASIDAARTHADTLPEAWDSLTH